MNIYKIKIGDKISPALGLNLCEYFKLNYLVYRLEYNLDNYSDFKFDGCSCLPDDLLTKISGDAWKDVTYSCCLPHDLCYAYGMVGNSQERQTADENFYYNLVLEAKMPTPLAELLFRAVRLGGRERFKMSFSWGFANRNLDRSVDGH